MVVVVLVVVATLLVGDGGKAPALICAMSSRWSQIGGEFRAFVIRSAICCLVLTYRKQISGA